jgi:predicted HTH domain antitoxin
MNRIAVDVPDRALDELHMTSAQLAAEMRHSAAAHLYDLGRLSLHQAAELAGIDEFTFRRSLSDYGIAVFRLGREELEAELE